MSIELFLWGKISWLLTQLSGHKIWKRRKKESGRKRIYEPVLKEDKLHFAQVHRLLVSK